MNGLNHTFIFGVAYDHNIDGGAKGNIARWINHSCDPNCDTYEKDKRMFIRAIRDIRPARNCPTTTVSRPASASPKR